MIKKYICIALVMSMFACSFSLSVSAAPAVPTFEWPLQYSTVNGNTALTVEWNAPAGTVSNYVISVRQLSNNKEPTSVLIVDGVSLSSDITKYKIPWSKLGYGRSYRVSVCANMANGTKKWSAETYFYTATYKAVANKTLSFHIYDGFSTNWKNAIYYAAQAWKLGLNYEVVNTYSFSECHNNNTVISGDGLNRITSAVRSPNDSSYLMVTKLKRTSTGKVKEADININTTEYNFTVGAKSGYYDVQAVMTHEMGHAVGMAHSFEPYSSDWTMYHAGFMNDISKRSLEAGDRMMFHSLYLNI